MVNPYTCAFEYDGLWLADGFSISPFQLPLEKKVFVANREPFAGNFGVFEDSLPDGWGRLLVDRLLVKRGVNPAELSILDRLAIVGSSGMGALEYKPETVLAAEGGNPGLAELAKEAEAIMEEVRSICKSMNIC
jgi:serine/threonine-protein kinase HipA